jgi:hypothetical protein
MAIDRRFLNVKLTVTGTANNSTLTVEGTQFIVGASPTGNFAAATANDIAQYQGGAWRFWTPARDNIEVIDLGTNTVKRFNGTAWEIALDLNALGGAGGSSFWIDPVLSLVPTGASTPSVAAGAGLKFLNLTDGKLYTSTAIDTWDSGAATSDGDRYASSTDAKIYVKEAGTFTGAVPPDGTCFVVKDVDIIYTYDAQTTSIKSVGDSENPDATYTTKGVMSVQADSGLAVNSGQLSLTRVTGVYKYVLTSTNITNKAFTLPKKMVAGAQNYVGASVGGVAQVNGVDFSIVLDSDSQGVGTCDLSWANSEALDSVGLVAGDVFLLTYPTDNI